MKNVNDDELRKRIIETLKDSINVICDDEYKVSNLITDMALSGATDWEILEVAIYFASLKKKYQMEKLDKVKTRYLYRSIVDSMITMPPEYMNNLYNAFPDNIRNQYSFMANSMKRI